MLGIAGVSNIDTLNDLDINSAEYLNIRLQHATEEDPVSSSSWKEMRPIQVMNRLPFSLAITAYQILKAIFWRLPVPLRRALNGTRYAAVRKFRTAHFAGRLVAAKNRSGIDWDEFKQNVLSRRDEYKGVFIQEVVIDWNVPLYQRPQHMATALARLGYLVIYKTVNWSGDSVNGFQRVADNIWLTNRCEVDNIERAVRSIYSTAYAVAPKKLARGREKGVMVYEYIDHIDPAISGDDENMRRLNELRAFALSGGADVIVASAKKLFDEIQALNLKQNLLLIPNGVDTDHYRNQRHGRNVLPAEYTDFVERYDIIVGYFGAIAPWLWYSLVDELVNLKAEVGFIFIGPDYFGGLDKLPKSENFLYVDSVPYDTLPAYAKCFDICFIPFAPGEIAQSTSPLKLFEYFALEKPVVVTSDMRECTAFPEVLSADSAAGISDAIDHAIATKDDPIFKARLRELADQNSWLERAKTFEQVFSRVKC